MSRMWIMQCVQQVGLVDTVSHESRTWPVTHSHSDISGNSSFITSCIVVPRFLGPSITKKILPKLEAGVVWPLFLLAYAYMYIYIHSFICIYALNKILDTALIVGMQFLTDFPCEHLLTYNKTIYVYRCKNWEVKVCWILFRECSN